MTAERLAKQLLPSSGKELVRTAARRFGTATAARRPLPDYLVVGTKRGGTTSVWKNLRAHPQVMSMFPEAEYLKSPHFFDIHWSRGLPWYRSHFPTQAARRDRAEQVGGPVAVGDVSPYYLFHPRAAERARAVVPAARVVVLLRNPVERAWSHYHERRKEGTEPLSFTAALEAEEERLARERPRMAADPFYYSRTHDFSSYLARGRYWEQLQPWLACFPATQVLILRSETYYEQPASTLRELVGFLGLDPDLLPAGALEHLNRLPAEPMPVESRRFLEDYYRPSVAALEAGLGRHFGWDLAG